MNGCRRSARMPNGLPRSNVGLRMNEHETRDVDIAALRLGVDRSTALRHAAAILVQAVDDAWYAAQIGGEPSPSIENLIDRTTTAMAAEITASGLLIQRINSGAFEPSETA